MGKVLRLLGILALLLAVGLGTIGKISPNLLLKIPNYGFILWAITGNRMPPHFDAEPLNEGQFHRWAEDGDIILATMPKSGTALLAQILHLLKSGGNDDYNFQYEVTGMLEMWKHPEDDLETRLRRETSKRKPGVPMTWFSHKCPNAQNYGMNVKLHPAKRYVGVAREAHEVIKSLHPFLNSHTKEFSDMWGGFPPLPISKEEVVSMMSNDLKEMYFDYLKAWWPLRHEPNVLLLHYADLRLDLEGQVRRIAKFLDVALSDELLASTTDKASIQHMKANGHKYVQHGGPNNDILILREGHINKGQLGGASDFFTAEMNATWEAACKKEFAGADPEMLKWAADGGQF